MAEHTRTNYRITGKNIDDDVVTATKILTSNIQASHLSATSLDNHIKRGVASVTTTAAGLASVATGLASPVYGIASPTSSGAQTQYQRTMVYSSAAGSKIFFHCLSLDFSTNAVSGNTGITVSNRVIASANIKFNYIAFET